MYYFLRKGGAAMPVMMVLMLQAGFLEKTQAWPDRSLSVADPRPAQEVKGWSGERSSVAAAVLFATFYSSCNWFARTGTAATRRVITASPVVTHVTGRSLSWGRSVTMYLVFLTGLWTSSSANVSTPFCMVNEVSV